MLNQKLTKKDMAGFLLWAVLAFFAFIAYENFTSGRETEVSEAKPVDPIEQVVSIAKAQCFKNEAELKGVEVLSKSKWPISFNGVDYAYKVEIKIPDKTELYWRVNRINGHVCHIYMNEALDTMAVHKDVCKNLCGIPLKKSGHTEHKRIP